MIFFPLSLFSCYLASIFTLSLALSMPSLSLSPIIFLPLFSLSTTFFGAAAFYIFALLVPFLCLVCSLGANNRKVLYFAVNYSQQMVYLDFSSLILLYSSVTFSRAPQQLKTPTNTDELLSMLKFSSD